jgi:addiction module HigA family antidote
MLRQRTRPGEILLVEYCPLGLSQAAFARHIGWAQPKVNEIVTGKRSVTAETAMVLADALDTTPLFWLNLQMTLYLWHATNE